MPFEKVLLRLTISLHENSHINKDDDSDFDDDDTAEEDSCQIRAIQTLPYFIQEEPKNDVEKADFREIAESTIEKLQAAEKDIRRLVEAKACFFNSERSSGDKAERETSDDGAKRRSEYVEDNNYNTSMREKSKTDEEEASVDRKRERINDSSDSEAESHSRLRRSSRPRTTVNYTAEWDPKTGKLLDRKQRLAEEKWALLPAKEASKRRLSKEKEQACGNDPKKAQNKDKKKETMKFSSENITASKKTWDQHLREIEFDELSDSHSTPSSDSSMPINKSQKCDDKSKGDVSSDRKRGYKGSSRQTKKAKRDTKIPEYFLPVSRNQFSGQSKCTHSSAGPITKSHGRSRNASNQSLSDEIDELNSSCDFKQCRTSQM